MTHKQVIVIRRDLKMRRGKEIAQGCHASNAVLLNLLYEGNWFTRLLRRLNPWGGLRDPRIKPWVEGNFKKVCVVVNSEEELMTVFRAAGEKGILRSLITDAGLTEFKGIPTRTCIAIGPDTEANINEVTEELKLY
jgi:peptidyl-tRNA hydrolase, PTH2 family